MTKGKRAIATKRILFFTHATQFGGAEHSLLELIKRLDPEKWEARLLFLTQGPLADAFEQAGFAIHIIETPALILDTKRNQFFTNGNIRDSLERIKLVRPLVRAVGEYASHIGADLIYSNSSKAHIISAFAGRKAKIPVLWHVRDYHTSRRLRTLYYWIARFGAGDIVCNSRFVAEQFPKHPCVNVVYSGIDPDAAMPKRQPAEVRAELGIPEGAPVIGMAGRLDPWKGHRVFLRAAARILEDIRDTQFLIIGGPLYSDPSYEDHLKALAVDYGIAKQVFFTGFRMDVPDLMNIMNIYMHPSEEPEPFGRGIVEAMLLEKPVVASAAGGPEEIVRHAETGILVEPGDSVALARAAVQLLDNPEVSQALGRNGRVRALEAFTLDRTSAAIHDILEAATV